MDQQAQLIQSTQSTQSTQLETETIEQLKKKMIASEEESTQIIIKLDKRISEVRNNLQITQEKCDMLTTTVTELTNTNANLTKELTELTNKYNTLLETNEKLNTELNIRSTQSADVNNINNVTTSDDELKYYIQEYLKAKKEKDDLETELNETKKLCLQLVDKLKHTNKN